MIETWEVRDPSAMTNPSAMTLGDAGRVRRGEVAGQDHGGLLQGLEAGGLFAHELGGDLGCHVAYVVGAGREVLIFRTGEHLRVLLADGQHRGLRTR
jgi:hypothetical protein